MDIHRCYRRSGLVSDTLSSSVQQIRGRLLWLLRGLAFAALLAAIVGCSSAVRWDPRSQPSAKPTRSNAGEHIVRAGDTLHSIAFRYGVDVRNLVRWNQLDNPDFLLVGQRLRLKGPPARSAASAAQSSSQPANRGAKPLPPLPQVAAPRWLWPASGPLVSRFGEANQVGQGIAIGGDKGVPIQAAAAGRVVYKGSGLIGYGQLVIIKHNATYLSAYGHNDRVLVDEGEQVQAGENIARMGQGTDGTSQLLFEIRKNGEPVDPLIHLPRR